MMRVLSSLGLAGTLRFPTISGRRVFCPRLCAVSFARKSLQSQSDSNQRLSSDEVWKAWQFGGSSIENIMEKHKASRDSIFQHLMVAIKAGKPIDWTALCKEVGLSGAAASEIFDHLAKAGDEKIKLTVAITKRLNLLGITKEQTELCVLMRERGYSLEDIKRVLCLEPGYFEDETGRLRILCDELRKSRKIKKDFFIVSQGRKEVLDQGLMDLLRGRNGATLVEIAAFFSDCDPKQLVHLLWKLESSEKITTDGLKYIANV